LKLIKKILPDSKIAQKTHCGRTKSEAIVENVSSPHSIEVMINKMREMNPKPYSISSDASNKGNLKHFPLVITIMA
jgi:sulfite reductase alpha subunit-like flavoprotein